MLKRPHVDEFLQRMGELFECVLFTASLAKVTLPIFPGVPGTILPLPLPPEGDLWGHPHPQMTCLPPHSMRTP